MNTYSHFSKNTKLEHLGTPEVLGGKTLSENDITFSAHCDFGSVDEPMSAGLFEATKGRFSITYPFSELATLVDGEIQLTDESGNSVTYKGGDGCSWFVRKGETIIWDVKTETARKSFFLTKLDL
ncbi:MAG: cupin domain-containing protein [Pseudomonadales bacterium]